MQTLGFLRPATLGFLENPKAGPRLTPLAWSSLVWRTITKQFSPTYLESLNRVHLNQGLSILDSGDEPKFTENKSEFNQSKRSV